MHPPPSRGLTVHPLLAVGGGSAAQRLPQASFSGPSVLSQGASLDTQSGRPRVYQTAERLGLLGPFGGADTDGWASGQGTVAQLGMVDRLRRHARTAFEEVVDDSRLTTALNWASDFVSSTGRTLFLDPTRAGAERYNAESLELLTSYIRLRGSRKPGQRGRVLPSDYIADLVSTVRLLREREARHLMVRPEHNLVLPLVHKRHRQLDPPKGQRRLCRAFRAYMLRQAAAAGYDRSTSRGLMRWTAALLAHNLLLRGSELGRPGKPGRLKAFDPARDLTPSSVCMREACAESDGCPWLSVSIVADKDANVVHEVEAHVIRRRSRTAAFLTDPLCTYDHLVAWLAVRRGDLSRQLGCLESDPALHHGGGCQHPLFVSAARAWCTADTQELACDLARAIGLDPSAFGGKSFRAGGATDIAALLGEGGKARLKKRGRWASDVALIYERALAEPDLSLSASLGDAAGRDLEGILGGWTQPASFR